jgi:hypothetical protein
MQQYYSWLVLFWCLCREHRASDDELARPLDQETPAVLRTPTQTTSAVVRTPTQTTSAVVCTPTQTTSAVVRTPTQTTSAVVRTLTQTTSAVPAPAQAQKTPAVVPGPAPKNPAVVPGPAPKTPAVVPGAHGCTQCCDCVRNEIQASSEYFNISCTLCHQYVSYLIIYFCLLSVQSASDRGCMKLLRGSWPFFEDVQEWVRLRLAGQAPLCRRT